MFKVEIRNIKIKTKIGVSAIERRNQQLLLVSIKFNYILSPKTNLDNIRSLKDYSSIIKFLKNFIKKSKYKTLEKLILELKKQLKNQFQINNLFLRIEKPIVAKKYGCDSISVSE